MGTDNEKLRNDPYYLGLDQPRVSGSEYYEILDEVSRLDSLSVCSQWHMSPD